MRPQSTRLSLQPGALLVMALVFSLAACAPPPPTGPATGGAGAAPAAAPATPAGQLGVPAATEVAKPAAAKPATAPAGDRVLRVGSVSDIVTLHPARLGVASDRMMAGMVYSNLVRFKYPTTEILPDLAEKWDRSPDGKTYTFHLRKGVQFHQNLGELTASDVKFTIEFYQDKDKSVKSRSAGLFEAVRSVDTPDPYTVVINLSAPFIGFMETLAWQNAFIVSEKAAKALGENLTHQPVGTGPFELTKWSKGQEIVFSRFDKYFGEKPRVAEVRVKIIPEQSTQILAVSNGELDAAYVSTIPALKTARATPNVTVLEQPSNWVNVVWLNLQSGPTTNPKVRQALAYAIDAKGISEASGGFSQPSVTMLNPFTFGYTTDVPTYAYDPNKARALLAEGGYNNEPIGIVYYPSGQYGELAQIVKDAWTKAGVNAQLEQVDAATWTSRGAAGQFGAYLVGIARNTPDEYFSPAYRTGGPSNYGRYSNPKSDELIVQARSQSDEATSKQLYAQLQRQILTDLPVIPVSIQAGVWAIGPKVKNFTYDNYAAVAGFRFVQLD